MRFEAHPAVWDEPIGLFQVSRRYRVKAVLIAILPCPIFAFAASIFDLSLGLVVFVAMNFFSGFIGYNDPAAFLQWWDERPKAQGWKP
jgi:hypothetical protein